MAPKIELGTAVRVSPLIKFGRWSFLGLGVMYGAFHQNRLEKREVGIRAVEEEHKKARDAKLAAEKKIAIAEEEKALAELSNPSKK